MNPYKIYRIILLLTAFIWLVNGLYCKILRMVPRHEQIVARILGSEYSVLLTRMIGVSEILMAGWIISLYKPKINVYFQILIVGLMNILEIIMARDLLLWGFANLFFALVFILIIYYNEFFLRDWISD